MSDQNGTIFISRPGSIEARRVPYEVNDDLHALCRWAGASLRLTATQHPRVQVPVCAHDHTYVEAFPGEWVVKYPGESVAVLTNQEFRAAFDVVPGDEDEVV